jgi:hypothetical protein
MAHNGNGATGDQGRPPNNITDHPAADDPAGRLSDLARASQHEDSVDETLRAIVHAAVGTVPGAQYAALSVVEHRRAIYTRAGTA